MKDDFVDGLVCIRDGERLELSGRPDLDDNDITDGVLKCGACGTCYEITRGVPCLLDASHDREELARFGEQWTWFLEGQFEDVNESQYGEDQSFIIKEFFDITGLSPDRLEGKRILDAGSGASKIAYYLTTVFPDRQFEIVSLEFSESVYAGATRVSDPRVHHVRSNILASGLKPGSFDVVHCVGVLHHTPDPRRSFDALVPLLKPGGTIVTWNYSKRFNPFLDVTGLVWPVTRHLPSKVILAIAYLMSPFFWIAFRLGVAVKAVFKPKSWRWRWVTPLSFGAIRLHLFDYMQTYYRFRYWPDEILPWYEENELTDIVVVRPGSNAIRGTRKST